MTRVDDRVQTEGADVGGWIELAGLPDERKSQSRGRVHGQIETDDVGGRGRVLW